MALKNKTALTTTLLLNITDELNQQNTAARVREVNQDIIDSTVNLLDLNLNLGGANTISSGTGQIVGGFGNVIGGTYSRSSIVGGFNNIIVDAPDNLVVGSYNDLTPLDNYLTSGSIIGGSQNTVRSACSLVVGIYNTVINSSGSIISGTRAKAIHSGESIIGAGGTTLQSQTGTTNFIYPFNNNITSGNTPTELYQAGNGYADGSGGFLGWFNILTNTIYRVRIYATAVNIGGASGTTGATVSFTGAGTIKNIAGTTTIQNASPSAITMSQVDADATMTGCSMSVTSQPAVGSNGYLKIMVTGLATTNITWIVRLDYEQTSIA